MMVLRTSRSANEAAAARTRVFHGKRGWGVSVEFDVKHDGDSLRDHTATRRPSALCGVRRQVVDGPLLQIGNTTSRIDFDAIPVSGATPGRRAPCPPLGSWTAIGAGAQRACELLGIEMVTVGGALVPKERGRPTPSGDQRGLFQCQTARCDRPRASSARLFAGRLDRDRLEVREVVRLRNWAVQLPDGSTGICCEFISGCSRHLRSFPERRWAPLWIGIDSWGSTTGSSARHAGRHVSTNESKCEATVVGRAPSATRGRSCDRIRMPGSRSTRLTRRRGVEHLRPSPQLHPRSERSPKQAHGREPVSRPPSCQYRSTGGAIGLSGSAQVPRASADELAADPSGGRQKLHGPVPQPDDLPDSSRPVETSANKRALEARGRSQRAVWHWNSPRWSPLGVGPASLFGHECTSTSPSRCRAARSALSSGARWPVQEPSGGHGALRPGVAPLTGIASEVDSRSRVADLQERAVDDLPSDTTKRRRVA